MEVTMKAVKSMPVLAGFSRTTKRKLIFLNITPNPPKQEQLVSCFMDGSAALT